MDPEKTLNQSFFLLPGTCPGSTAVGVQPRLQMLRLVEHSTAMATPPAPLNTQIGIK